MAQILVTIIDSMSREQKAELPDDIPMKRLIPELLRRMNITNNSADGQPIRYSLWHDRTGERLLADDTLDAMGIRRGDKLKLLPILTFDDDAWFLDGSLAAIQNRLRYSQPVCNLTAGDKAELIQELEELEGQDSESPAVIHNLAILYHSQALQLEEDGNFAADRCWKAALSYWKQLWALDGYWLELSEKGRKFGGNQFKEQSVQNLRDNLPETLLQINKDFAMTYWRNEQTEDAKRHLEYIKTSGFTFEVIEKIRAETADPVLEVAERNALIGEFDNAVNLLERYLEVDPQLKCVTDKLVEILLNKGFQSLDAEQLELAKSSFVKVLEYDGMNVKAIHAITYIDNKAILDLLEDSNDEQ